MTSDARETSPVSGSAEDVATDPRDPRGLRHDAPLLDGWLRVTEQIAEGKFIPMAVPGHKQPQDLTGAVNLGDAPLYGGVDSIKHADVPRADAERRAARLWAPTGAASPSPAPPTATRRWPSRSARRAA